VDEQTTPSVIEMKPTSDEQKPPINDQYEVLIPEQFRTLISRYPNATAEPVVGYGEKLVYSVSDNAFITDAKELGILIVHTPDDTTARILTFPEQLHKFIGAVSVHEDGDETMYTIVVRNKEIKIDANQLADIAVWRAKVFHRCGLVVSFDVRSRTNRDAFSAMLADILNRAAVVWHEEVSEGDMVADVMMNRIRKLPIVVANEDFVNSRTILDHDDVYLIATSTVEKMLNDYTKHMRLSDIRKTLNAYLARNSEQKMFGGQRFSVWFFKKWERD
jgi:hypothetical protein